MRLRADGKARVDSDMRMTERVFVRDRTGIVEQTVPILDVYQSEVTGLPEAEDGVLYVVSGIVASHVVGRDDVVSPGRVERDPATGRARAARALIRVH